jgi:hypothetical protein
MKFSFANLSMHSNRHFYFFIVIERNELQWKQIELLTQNIFTVTDVVKGKTF